MALNSMRSQGDLELWFQGGVITAIFVYAGKETQDFCISGKNCIYSVTSPASHKGLTNLTKAGQVYFKNVEYTIILWWFFLFFI